MRIRFALSVVLCAVVSADCRTTSAPPSVAKTPLTAVPQHVLSRAATVSGLPVEVIQEETRYRFHPDGTKTETQRLTFRVLNPRGVEDWSQVTATYRPWFEARPEMSAKVTAPDGEVFSLDQATVAEAPVTSGEGAVLSDARRVVAPLPALATGALVEQTVTKRETRPFFGAGTVGRFYFGMGVPVYLSRVVLEVPDGVDLDYEVRGMDLEPVVTEAEGHRVLTFEVGPLMPQGRPTLFMPADTARYPYVAFSTAATWNDVARRYFDLVEAQLNGFDARSLVQGINPKQTRAELVAALSARLHETVRYTGIEFGRQSIVPWAPKVTLSRRFGDCKDKGALLIAMLRAVGLDGHLALLRSGFGEDVRPNLPGLEPFNHAIVYIPGKPELWVDATASFVRVGRLPTSVQGRWALIAAPGTDELRRLPSTPAKENRYVESRTITMSDWGPVEVVERTLAFGSMEERLRAQFADSSDDQVHEALEKYVQSSYKAEALTSYQMSNPKDLRVPFEIEVRAEQSSVGYTSSEEAAVRLTNAIVFSWLPKPIRLAALAAGSEDPNPDRRRAVRSLARRQDDFVWPEPYLAEVGFQVHPPVGYALRHLPDSRKLQLGPGYFEARYRRRQDGGVDADFRLAVGQRRYSADELRAFVAGLERLWNEKIPTLSFDHEGARLLMQGKLREGISNYRRLARSNADSALHQARLAEALLKVQLGEAARAAAARAVKLQPDSPYAHYTQAWVLQHDRFGRPYKPGFDRVGAVAAYEEVLRLEEDNTRARLNLARLLEYDGRGRRYAHPEGLEAAIANYRRLRKRSDAAADLDDTLLMALFQANRCAELSVLVRDTKRSLTRDGLEVTCAVVLRGMTEGLRVLDAMALPPPARQAVIEATVRFLVMSRRYDSAREVALMAIPGAEDPVSLESQVRTLTRLKPFERVRLSDKDPARVVQQLYEAMFDRGGDDYERFFARDSLRAPHGDALKASLRRELAALSKVQDGDMPHSILRDSVISLTKFEAEGSDRTGYRVTTRVEGGPDIQTQWFVVKEDGRYRIRGGSGSAWLVGVEALKRAQRGRWADAAQWLDWGRGVWSAAAQAGGSAVLPFMRAWPPPAGERSKRRRISAAAALLAAMGPGDRGVVRALERSRADFKNDPGLRKAIDHAEFLQFDELDDDDGRLRSAKRFRGRTSNSELAHVFWTRALVEAGRYKEAKAEIVSRQAAEPEESLAVEQLADLAVRQNDFKSAERLLKRLIDEGRASARTYNNLAWLRLFGGRVDDDDLGFALRANSLSGFKDAGQLHTLAAIYAETGRAREALQLMAKRLDLLGRSEPANEDWYLLGRIHEHFELFDLARTAYGRVKLAPDERGPDSTHALAQRKLRGLRQRIRGQAI